MSKVVNTPMLMELRAAAWNRNYNRTLPEIRRDMIDPNGYHIVKAVMDHGDGSHLRCMVLIKLAGKDEPLESTLDVGYSQYERLPTTKEAMDALQKAREPS